MQRRKVDQPPSSPDASDTGISTTPSKLANRRSPGTSSSSRRRSRSGSSMSPVVYILVGAIILLGIASFLFPSQIQNVEKKTAQQLVHNAYQMEQEMEKHVGQLLHTTPKRTSEEATAAMMAQPSRWVDGEKKLKEKLKVLQDRQQRGLDLGVPVLTRYLGEDVPAWVEKGMDEKEWRQKVDQRYKEMAEEEKQWRESIRTKIDERLQST